MRSTIMIPLTLLVNSEMHVFISGLGTLFMNLTIKTVAMH